MENSWNVISCFSIAGTVQSQNPRFKIKDTKLYVPVVFLSTLHIVKLLQQLERGFKKTINWNKYQSKLTHLTINRNLDFLIVKSFQGVNRLFVSSFEDKRVRETYKQYFLPTVEIKDCNVAIDERNFFDQPVKNILRRYDNIRKITIDQGDDYTTGYLIDYPYFKNYDKLISIDLNKQQKLDADPKAIQQINFTGNLDRGGITHMFFIIEEVK